jgi:hypothetical protein
MSTVVKPVLVLVGISLLLASCSRQAGPPRKETFPVKGEVYVDGKPAGSLAVTCVDVKGMDAKQPTNSTAMTGEDGKFEISTYQKADGVPEGEYILTFEWGQLNLINMSYGGPDKLNGRYKESKDSKHRFKVEKGKPTDLGKIELTTK